MAERPANSKDLNDNDGGDDDETNSLKYNKNKNINNNRFMQLVPSNDTSTHATYIVQIPKDQIYRVPPPENAEIVQRYRNPVEQKQRGGGGRRCAYWFFSIFFLFAFIISVIVCVHKFTLSPSPPVFSIKHISINNSSKSTSKSSPSHGFQVSMQTTNHNNVNDLGYKQGVVSLMYKGKQIGRGHFPAMDNQGAGKTDDVNITLAGSSSKGGLPSDLEPNYKSRSRNNGKPVDMDLSIDVPIKMKTWLWTNTVDFSVKCEFEVEPIGDHLQIQTENCNVHK